MYLRWRIIRFETLRTTSDMFGEVGSLVLTASVEERHTAELQEHKLATGGRSVPLLVHGTAGWK